MDPFLFLIQKNFTGKNPPTPLFSTKLVVFAEVCKWLRVKFSGIDLN